MGPICQIAWSLGSVHIIRNMGWGGVQIYHKIIVWAGIWKGLDFFSASNEEKKINNTCFLFGTKIKCFVAPLGKCQF